VPIAAYGNHGPHLPHAIPHIASLDALREFLVCSLRPSP